jgi:hypothetical protein
MGWYLGWKMRKIRTEEESGRGTDQGGEYNII